MLIPDKSFQARRPHVEEIHLTLAYLGRFEDGSALAQVRRQIHQIAKHIGGPIKATANAVGIFPDRSSFALVDLIDGIDVFYARKHVEALFGRASGSYDSLPVKVDYTHGFTPHVTNTYLTEEDAQDILFGEILPSDPIEFTFDSIGLWHGHNHYEVAL
jgi:2'-5' RNA ligase